MGFGVGSCLGRCHDFVLSGGIEESSHPPGRAFWLAGGYGRSGSWVSADAIGPCDDGLNTVFILAFLGFKAKGGAVIERQHRIVIGTAASIVKRMEPKANDLLAED